MKTIHEISSAVANLEEQSSGKLVAGFTILAPEQLSSFLGGRVAINNGCNNNCNGGNCVTDCGTKKDVPTIDPGGDR